MWHNGLRIQLQWLKSLQRYGFNTWPGNFHILQVQQKKKKIQLKEIGVPVMAQWKRIQLGIMRFWV